MTNFYGFMNSKKIRKWWTQIAWFPKKFINSYQVHVWRWGQYPNHIFWRLRPMPLMSSCFLEPRPVHHQQIQTARVSGRHLSSTLPWIHQKYKSPKVFNMWNSRTLVMFSTLNSYVCWPVVADRTVFVFFHMQHKQMGSTYALPHLGSHDPEVLLYTWGTSESVFFDTRRPRGILALSPSERKNTFSSKNKDASSLACFMEVIAKWQSKCFFRRLFWVQESLTGTTVTCHFVLGCLAFFGSNLKKSGSEHNVKILNKIT